MEGEGDFGEMDVWAQAKWKVFYMMQDKIFFYILHFFWSEGVIKHAHNSLYTLNTKEWMKSPYATIVWFHSLPQEVDKTNILSSMQNIIIFFF